MAVCRMSYHLTPFYFLNIIGFTLLYIGVIVKPFIYFLTNMVDSFPYCPVHISVISYWIMSIQYSADSWYIMHLFAFW